MDQYRKFTRIGILVALLVVCVTSAACWPGGSPTVPATTAVINLFQADVNPIGVGAATIVRWDVSGAQTVRIDPVIGGVASSGNRQIILNQSTTLTLSAVDSAGLTVQGQLTIVVK